MNTHTVNFCSPGLWWSISPSLRWSLGIFVSVTVIVWLQSWPRMGFAGEEFEAELSRAAVFQGKWGGWWVKNLAKRKTKKNIWSRLIEAWKMGQCLGCCFWHYLLIGFQCEIVGFCVSQAGGGGLRCPEVLRNKTCYWTPVMEIENEGSAVYLFLMTPGS